MTPKSKSIIAPASTINTTSPLMIMDVTDGFVLNELTKFGNAITSSVISESSATKLSVRVNIIVLMI